MLHVKFMAQFPLYSITSTRTKAKPRKTCFNHVLILVVLFSFSLLIFHRTASRLQQFPNTWWRKDFSTACDKAKYWPIFPSLHTLVTHHKESEAASWRWVCCVQGSCCRSTFQSGTAQSLRRIPGASRSPQKLAKWGQHSVGSTSLPALPPSFGFGVVKLGFWEGLHHPASFTASQPWTGPPGPSFPRAGWCWQSSVCPSTARPYLWTASLAVLPQPCALVCLWVWTAI